MSDTDFFIEFSRGHKGRVYAHIDYMTSGPSTSMELVPSFLIEYLDGDVITEINITGEAIDYFFNPAIAFYSERKSSGAEVNLLYDKKIVSSWDASFEDKQISMNLSYGNILQRGVLSDLKLHPCLTVKFDGTTDFEYINRLYSLVRNFLKVIHYSSRIGKLRVELYTTKDSHLSYSGRLHDYKTLDEEYYPTNVNADYRYLEKYIGRIFKLMAADKEYTFFHYPKKGVRYRGHHYSLDDFKNIYGAFESECQKSPEEYEEVDSAIYVNIREKMCECLSVINVKELSADEKWFLGEGLSKIKGIGKRRGQEAKIKNAYNVLYKALDGSLEYIIHLPKNKIISHLGKKEIKELAADLTSLRSKITHGNQNYFFTDEDVTKIKFLEILTYCQFLKRAELSDREIEEVIGVIFGCNYILLSQRLSDI